jgi:hypothetical protein
MAKNGKKEKKEEKSEIKVSVKVKKGVSCSEEINPTIGSIGESK